MTSRSTYSGASTPPLSGVDFLNEYSARVKTLFDVSCLPLTAVGGTGDAVTATCDPALTAGFLDGMKFTITWGAANTGAMTLAINGGSALPVIDADGTALAASAAISGRRVVLEYLAGSFRVLGGAGGGSGGGPLYQAFTASGTWTKPSGYDANTPVLVRLWAGGGSGAYFNGSRYAGGGGGGGYSSKLFRMSELPSSVSVTVGSGGASQTTLNTDGLAGGDTSFGSLLTAYHGAGGLFSGAAPSLGGGGGGLRGGGSTSTNGSFWELINGGGHGGKSDTVSAVGYDAYYGGAGGGSAKGGPSYTAGGTSVFGGNGGAGSSPGTAGAAPGGGGGAGYNVTGSGAGARGEAQVLVIA